MKYYRLKNVISAFESDGSQDNLITKGMVALTDDELSDHLRPVELAKTTQEQIDDLENSVTKRNYREYLKGIKNPGDVRFVKSTKMIDEIDAEIELLRAKL